jgi:hypothetical protein
MPGRTTPLSFDECLREIDMFFEGRDKVHETMNRLVEALRNAGISYAIMGGMAVNAHGHRRTTKDVDVLLTQEGFEEFRKRFVGSAFEPVPQRRRRFTDRANGIELDVLVTGRYPGSGKPGPIAFPDPEDVSEVIDDRRVVNLATLVQLKLAAHRFQDFADVVSLIHVHNLDESFQEKLHPSVHRDYIECLEEKRREDEYEAREASED